MALTVAIVSAVAGMATACAPEPSSRYRTRTSGSSYRASYRALPPYPYSELRSQDADVRLRAVRRLGGLADREVSVAYLVRALNDESDPEVARAILAELGRRLGSPEQAAPVLTQPVRYGRYLQATLLPSAVVRHRALFRPFASAWLAALMREPEARWPAIVSLLAALDVKPSTVEQRLRFAWARKDLRGLLDLGPSGLSWAVAKASWGSYYQQMGLVAELAERLLKGTVQPTAALKTFLGRHALKIRRELWARAGADGAARAQALLRALGLDPSRPAGVYTPYRAGLGTSGGPTYRSPYRSPYGSSGRYSPPRPTTPVGQCLAKGYLHQAREKCVAELLQKATAADRAKHVEELLRSTYSGTSALRFALEKSPALRRPIVQALFANRPGLLRLSSYRLWALYKSAKPEFVRQVRALEAADRLQVATTLASASLATSARLLARDLRGVSVPARLLWAKVQEKGVAAAGVLPLLDALARGPAGVSAAFRRGVVAFTEFRLLWLAWDRSAARSGARHLATAIHAYNRGHYSVSVPRIDRTAVALAIAFAKDLWSREVAVRLAIRRMPAGDDRLRLLESFESLVKRGPKRPAKRR